MQLMGRAAEEMTRHPLRDVACNVKFRQQLASKNGAGGDCVQTRIPDRRPVDDHAVYIPVGGGEVVIDFPAALLTKRAKILQMSIDIRFHGSGKPDIHRVGKGAVQMMQGFRIG